MEPRHLLSIADLSAQDIRRLLKLAQELRGKRKRALRGKVLALLFEKPSLRTRVSFEVAMRQLGGESLFLSPQEVGLGKREPVADVARVLSRYVQGIVVRTLAQASARELARYASVPVINGLTDQEHPCQALADLLTIFQKKGELKGLSLAYIGDGNNVCRSLLLAAALMGMDFRLASPPGYEVEPEVLEKAQGYAAASGGRVSLLRDPLEAVQGADAVYTDVWTSMGQEAEAQVRRQAFRGFQVNESLLARAKPDVLFLHPLPAHPGEEIGPGLLDTPHSVVFDQAENRLHLQKAVLLELIGERDNG